MGRANAIKIEAEQEFLEGLKEAILIQGQTRRGVKRKTNVLFRHEIYNGKLFRFFIFSSALLSVDLLLCNPLRVFLFFFVVKVVRGEKFVG